MGAFSASGPSCPRPPTRRTRTRLSMLVDQSPASSAAFISSAVA
jgi:hypothetical protein